MGSSLVGFGVYIAALAAIGIIASAWLFKSPADNIKDSFNSIRKDIGNRMNATGNTTPPPPGPTSTGSANSPVSNDSQNPENINPPL